MVPTDIDKGALLRLAAISVTAFALLVICCCEEVRWLEQAVSKSRNW